MENERLSVWVEFLSPDPREGKTRTSSVAFGWQEAQQLKAKMIAELKSQSLKVVSSGIAAGRPAKRRNRI